MISSLAVNGQEAGGGRRKEGAFPHSKVYKK